MDVILANIIDGKAPFYFMQSQDRGQFVDYKNNGANLGFIGKCQSKIGSISIPSAVEEIGFKGQRDIALTTSYTSALVLMKATQSLSVYKTNIEKINAFLTGVITFKIQFYDNPREFFGIFWEAYCYGANINIADELAAAQFQMVVSGTVDTSLGSGAASAASKTQDLTTRSINSPEGMLELLSGNVDVLVRTIGNGSWDGQYLGLCGYGPCKTLSLGLMRRPELSKLRMVSEEMHKINCCMDPSAIKYCGLIPDYDCDPVMENWCHIDKNKNNTECNCINSKSLLPQCFDSKCYGNPLAYMKDKTCDRSVIDCVKIYALKHKEDYNPALQSICGPYDNLHNEYLEKGSYLKYKDIKGFFEDNWPSILITVIIFGLFICYINISQ
jgi:hypothetical protein